MATPITNVSSRLVRVANQQIGIWRSNGHAVRSRVTWNHPPTYQKGKHDDVAVGLTPDQTTVICWHPEPKFPYEHSRPLPRKDPSVFESDSVLKVQLMKGEEYCYRPDGPTDSELSGMFHTTKHLWYPKPARKFIKLKPPKDRDKL